MNTNEHPIDENVFSTRDLGLAATLMTLKFPLIGVDYQIEGVRQNPIGYFRFTNSLALKEAHQKYAQGLLAIEPRLFLSNIHSLKAEVTNMWKNPSGRAF